MEFVDKKTGEVFEIESTNLMNICGGDVNRCFTNELKKLVRQMAPGDKGAVSIKIKVECGYNDGLGEVCVMEADINTKYPKISLVDVTENLIDPDGVIVRRKERSLFEAVKYDKAV